VNYFKYVIINTFRGLETRACHIFFLENSVTFSLRAQPDSLSTKTLNSLYYLAFDLMYSRPEQAYQISKVYFDHHITHSNEESVAGV